MRAFPFGLEPVVAPRSPTPTAVGSTPSEPAPVPRIQCGHPFIDNCRDIVVEASATWLRHGSVAPWGAAGCRPAVFRHRGFDSLPAHRARHARQVPRRARSTRRRSSAGWSNCLSSRRSRVRVPSVAPRRRGRMEKAPAYEAGECRFDPCRRRAARRSSVDESTALRRRRGTNDRVPARRHRGLPPRKGSGQMRSPLAKRVRVNSPCGCESRPVHSRKRSGQIRGLSRKQVGVARPLWVRVPPLPPRRGSPMDTTPGPQPGGRGSTPRRGTDARSSNR
jgi:hypothetical protein